MVLKPRFLKRELEAEGYGVRLAENGRQLITLSFHNGHLDQLILDPDLPDTDISSLLTKLRNRRHLLPIVVHALPSYCAVNSDVLRAFPFVEKRGNSIEILNKIVLDILYRSDQEYNRAIDVG